MTRTFVAAILVSFLAFPLLAQTTIDNMPSSPACYIDGFGVPDTATFGQTITVPSTDTVLDSFSFIGLNLPSTLTFRAEVYAWDGAKATGSALYESAPMTGAGSSSGFQTITFSTGGVQLTGGAQYVLFLTASKDFFSSSGYGGMGTNCGDTYAGGSFFYFNNAWDFSELTTYDWQSLSPPFNVWDLAFNAVFSPPPAADLVVTKTDSPDPVVAGQDLTYTVTVTNAGNVDATNVQITDPLPAGLAFSSVAGQASTCNYDSPTTTVGCSMATLAAGASETVTIVVSVGSDVANGTVFSNTASATTDTTQSDTTNDSATEQTTVQTSADLVIAKSGAEGVIGGQQTQYTITVSNQGPSNAQNVVMTDVLPAGTTFVSIDSPAGWNCTTPAVGANGTVTCTIAALTAGDAPSQFTLTAAIDSSVTNGQTIQNIATISSDTSDPTPINDASSATATASATGVPTLSEWGLLTMLMAFAAFGALKLRA